MFKKPYQLKPQSSLRSSDKRKLKESIKSTFPTIPDEQFETVFPVKSQDVSMCKFTSHSNDTGSLISIGPNPLWLRLDIVDGNTEVVNRDRKARRENVWVPTVYTLWICPEILSIVYTHGAVFEKLFDGADLMLPGLIMSRIALPIFAKGDIVAIGCFGNKAPLAVAVALFSSEEIKQKHVSGDWKGRGFRVIHTVGDTLWSNGTKTQPPQIPFEEKDLIVSGGATVAGDGDVVSDGEEEEADAGPEGKEEGQELEGDEGNAGNEARSENEIEETQQAISELSLTNSAEGDNGEEAEEETTMSPAEVDDLLLKCLYYSLKTTLLPDKEKEYLPLSGSTLYSSHMIPNRPKGTMLDIKKSSHKKLTKFLKAVEKKGVLKVKEMKGGETLVMAIYRNHPELQAFVPSWKPHGIGSSETNNASDNGTSSGTTNAGSSTNSSPGKNANDKIEILDLFKPVSKIFDFMNAAGFAISKDDLFSAVEIKKFVDEYVKSKNLICADNPRFIEVLKDLDLASHVLYGKQPSLSNPSHQEYEDRGMLMREEITSRLTAKMTQFYLFSHPRLMAESGGEPIIRRGTWKPIVITVERRQGNKLITKVTGMESFAIEVDEFVVEVRKKCAGGVSVSDIKTTSTSGPSTSTASPKELLIQGEKVVDVCKVLDERWYIPFSGALKSVGNAGKGKSNTMVQTSRFVEVNWKAKSSKK